MLGKHKTPVQWTTIRVEELFRDCQFLNMNCVINLRKYVYVMPKHWIIKGSIKWNSTQS